MLILDVFFVLPVLLSDKRLTVLLYYCENCHTVNTKTLRLLVLSSRICSFAFRVFIAKITA